MQKDIVQNSRILIVDDKHENVVLLERMLRQGGYRYLWGIEDSRKALTAFSEFQPDLVALDLRMPHMDGFAFLNQVRSRIPEDDFVPVLVLTADASVKAKREALAAGAKDFLSKPFDMPEVLLRIYNLLETRWLHARISEANRTLEQRVKERTRELEEAQREILERLALAAELRDDDTGQHTQRVGKLSALLAQAIGLPEDQVDLIRQAAPLHDVGKIGVPDHILLKPGPLTPEERERIKSHAGMGARILSGSRFAILQMAERIALYHHEHWNGAGFHALAGESIPLEARIVALADAFDVITHSRPYKAAQSVSAAIRIMIEQKGKQFDPNLVDVFVKLERSNDLTRLSEALQTQTFGAPATVPVSG